VVATYISSGPVTPTEKLAVKKSKEKSKKRDKETKEYLKSWDASWKQASGTSGN
jgi:hypothetical protein